MVSSETVYDGPCEDFWKLRLVDASLELNIVGRQDDYIDSLEVDLSLQLVRKILIEQLMEHIW